MLFLARPFARNRPHFGYGHYLIIYFLQRRLGAQGVRPFLLDDRTVGGEEVFAQSFRDGLVDADVLQEKVVLFAQRSATMKPQAITSTKVLLSTPTATSTAYSIVNLPQPLNVLADLNLTRASPHSLKSARPFF
jgi:hypothetical protein